MKKIISLVAATVLFTAVLTFGSCKKDSDDDGGASSCVELAEKVQTTGASYISNPTSKEDCIAYKSAIQNYLDGCDAIPEAEKEGFQTAIDAMNCDQLD